MLMINQLIEKPKLGSNEKNGSTIQTKVDWTSKKSTNRRYNKHYALCIATNWVSDSASIQLKRRFALMFHNSK